MHVDFDLLMNAYKTIAYLNNWTPIPKETYPKIKNVSQCKADELRLRFKVRFVLFGWLCFTSHRHRGHLKTTPSFTVHCEGREHRFLHHSYRESNPGPSRGSLLHYRCTTPAPLDFLSGPYFRWDNFWT